MYLITKWFGVFLCDKQGIKEKILFSKNEKEIAENLFKIKQGNILDEENKIIKNVKELIVNEKRLQKIGMYRPDDPVFKKHELDLEKLGFSKDLLNKALISVTSKEVESKLKNPDLQIIQMINTLDDLIQTSNLLSERLDAWSVIPTSDEKKAPLVTTYEKVNDEIVNLEKQIEKDMEIVAPNIYKTIGPLIGARLISYAKGLDKLAFMPASTIQLLGAEKALFRFKKEGGKPPKHGIIFQHSYINKSPRNKRGRIARVFANKISIASKADAFTKRDISDYLKQELEDKIKRIKDM